jgi:two-component system NtrC family sensor kinase
MPASASEKILIVDEDPEVVDLIANQVLAPLGYEIATAYDGGAALQHTLRLTPDILITALELPGLSGRDLLAALRSQGLDTTVIALGPRGAESAALQAFRLGAKDYLAKPVREAELVASVDRALAEVRLRREHGQLAGKLAAANQQLEKRVKELTTLASIGKAVTAITHVGQLFNRLLEAGLFVTEAEIGWLLIVDDASSKLVLRAGKNLPASAAARLNAPFDDGISSLLLLSGEGITLHGEALARLRAGQIVKAAVAAPLKARDKVIGVLIAGNKSGQPFSERDQAMLAAVADYAVIAIVNSRLLQSAEAHAHSLQQAHDKLAYAAQGREAALQAAAQQLRAHAVQLHSLLEHLAHGRAGSLAADQQPVVAAGLDRVAAVQRLVEELAPPQAARPAEPRSH